MSLLDRAVCKLVVASGSIEATGFLASCRTTCGSISFIVTNNHVLPSEMDVGGTMVEFHSGLIIHGGDEEVVTLCLPPVRPCSRTSGSRGTTDDTSPASLFLTSIALDVTLVPVGDHTLKRLAAHGIVPIPLRRPTPRLRRGNAITLIHHPRGGPRTRSTDRVRGFGEGGKLKVITCTASPTISTLYPSSGRSLTISTPSLTRSLAHPLRSRRHLRALRRRQDGPRIQRLPDLSRRAW
jgi:hypothetical protein